jgi:hypothetical protein
VPKIKFIDFKNNNVFAVLEKDHFLFVLCLGDPLQQPTGRNPATCHGRFPMGLETFI